VTAHAIAPETKIDAPGDVGLLRASQRQWVADQADVKIAHKGRRTGFTFGEASDNVLIAATARGAGGDNVYYIGTTLDMAREYIDACGRWAVGLNYAASAVGEELLSDVDEHGNSRNIRAFRIDFPSGFFIQALSSRPRSLRGRQGVVVIDEAAFQDDLPGLIKAAIALIILGSKVRIISTHNGEDNYFNELIKDCLAGRIPYSVHKCTFDDAVKEGLYRTRCQAKGEPWTEEGERKFVENVRAFYRPNDAEELDCIPAQSGGTYLPLALIEPCVNPDIPVIRLSFKSDFVDEPEHVRRAEIEALCREQIEPVLARLNEEWPSFFGSDFGRTLDLTVMWPGQVAPNNRRVTAFILELRNCPFKEQEQIFRWVVDRLPRFSGGQLDARGNGSALAEAMRQFFGAARIVQVMLTRPWYAENWPRAKALIEDRDVDVPKDRDVQNDLRAVKVDKGVPVIAERTTGTGKTHRHGDAAIAYVLFAAAARMIVFAVGYEAPKGRPSDIYEPRGNAALDEFSMLPPDDALFDHSQPVRRRETW